jgi:hypothetical protein
MAIYAYVLPIEVPRSSIEKCGSDDGVCLLIQRCCFMEAAEMFLRSRVGRVYFHKFCVWEGDLVTCKVIRHSCLT